MAWVANEVMPCEPKKESSTISASSLYMFFSYMTGYIWLINDEGKLINLLVCMESIFRIGLEEEERKS